MSCWEKQKHEITAPIIPNYTLSGLVQDMDLGEVLAGREVKIEPHSLVYADAEMINMMDTSDTSGHYQLDFVMPGTYFIHDQSIYAGRYLGMEGISQ